ncbi:MAG: hypothetical protein OFPII_12340 [Osedax symbiont Rs1]|nr:MAG: hypothetical protein OFPII_12340 [Osedax symbiont Rs1]
MILRGDNNPDTGGRWEKGFGGLGKLMTILDMFSSDQIFIIVTQVSGFK